MQKQMTNSGKVIIAGAGPGDPELITRKAARYLGAADIVLTDRLVSDDILRDLVNPKAKVIYVGKQCRKGNSTPQATINELMIKHATAGRLVIRLKGGDVSIFSNILDELEALKQNSIHYEIIPGVSAALGAAAYAGIPLTAREHAASVRLLTYYKSSVIDDRYWKELAGTTDTLVFYMSAETLDPLIGKLQQHGAPLSTRIAVIEQATTPLQNIYTTSIREFHATLKGKQFVSPSLVIIGKVVELNEQFNWINNSGSNEYYFKPVAALNSAGKKNNHEKDAARA